MNISEEELERINRERRRKGLEPLKRAHVDTYANRYSRNDEGSSDFSGFLIGLTTGIPVSPMGAAGAMLHSASQPAAAASEPERSYTPPEPMRSEPTFETHNDGGSFGSSGGDAASSGGGGGE